MDHQTHYKTLDIDENASPDMVEFAYERLLKDAKDKLQDSPLFFEKEQNLKHAFQVLSSPSLRQAYNNKLAKERTTSNYSTEFESFNAAEFFGELLFSKAFLGSVVLIIVLLVIIPSGEQRTTEQVFNKQMDYEHDIRNQQMDMERQREERYIARQEHDERMSTLVQDQRETAEQRRFEMEERRLDLQQQREEAKIARKDRRLAIQEERAARNTEYELQRKAKREKQDKQRRKEYEANRRSREVIKRINRTGELQRDVNRLKAGY